MASSENEFDTPALYLVMHETSIKCLNVPGLYKIGQNFTFRMDMMPKISHCLSTIKYFKALKD